MLVSILAQSVTVPILTGSLVTYRIFKQYEPVKLPVLVALLVVAPGALVLHIEQHFTTALGAVSTTYTAYWTLILIFTVLYRISPFHPLAKYPGPLGCRVSKIWFAYLTAREKKAHVYVRELHKKYKSDVIRIGPNELSITNENFPEAVLGAEGLPRGPYYDTRMCKAGISLEGIRDLAHHHERRGVWTRAMNSANVKYYEEPLRDCLENFVTSLSERQGETVDLTEWITFFGFDFIGQIAFTQDYKMVKTGRDTYGMIKFFQRAAPGAACISHIPWLLGFLRWIPIRAKFRLQIEAINRQTIRRRVAAVSTAKDIFYHLMDEEGHERVRPAIEICVLDGQTAISAGSETVATALGNIWYLLLRNPAHFDTLRREVDEAFPPDVDTSSDLAKQAAMPYLNACINEALRVYPPVLGGLQRRVEKGTGGRMIGPYFVPEETQVSIWTYTLHRDSRYFSPLPDTFWPDRWLTQDTYVLPGGDMVRKDDIILNRDVFAPFSQGPMGCVGKNVALMEMRAVLCTMLQNFDVEVADWSSFGSYEDGLCEMFITKRSPLPVRLRLRKL